MILSLIDRQLGLHVVMTMLEVMLVPSSVPLEHHCPTSSSSVPRSGCLSEELPWMMRRGRYLLISSVAACCSVRHLSPLVLMPSSLVQSS